MNSARKQTLASAMYGQLRDDIVTAGIAPRTKLKIRDLCERFDVGLSPVREALSRLSMEGLVRQTDRRGFAVSDVSVPELRDLTKARCWINEIGIRQSIALGGPDWDEQIVLAYHRLSRTPRHAEGSPERNPEWEAAHREFHASLVAGCGSHWLIEICEKLFDASERYRHIGRLAGIPRGGRGEEHHAIMQAAVNRDADAAVRELNAHFQKTAELVEQVVGTAPGAGRRPARRPKSAPGAGGGPR